MRAREIAGYSIGDTGINFYFMASLTFTLYFYTEVFGISAAVAASVLLVARVVDAVTDPLMGRIADLTRTRWGKFRPYLLFGPIPLGLVTVAMFSTPDLSPSGKIAWANATYIGLSVGYGQSCGLLADGHVECWGNGEAAAPLMA